MKYHLIMNPAAGRGRAKKKLAFLKDSFEKQIGNVDFYQTATAGDAQKFAERLKNSGSIVIAAGGDGTIHEVANGLIGGNCTLGVIPLGTGNDFVKMLNLPLTIEDAISVIKKENVISIDAGKANDEYFINGMGIGFDADVVVESQKIQRLKGFPLYLYAVLRKIFSYQNRRVTIHANGEQQKRKIFLIVIGNGQYLGGGFRITPRAELDDGQMDVCILRDLSRLEIVRHLPFAIFGRHLHLRQVNYFRTTRLIVESAESLPVHLDGEMLGTDLKRIEISVFPGALKVIHHLKK